MQHPDPMLGGRASLQGLFRGQKGVDHQILRCEDLFNKAGTVTTTPGSQKKTLLSRSDPEYEQPVSSGGVNRNR